MRLKISVLGLPQAEQTTNNRFCAVLDELLASTSKKKILKNIIVQSSVCENGVDWTQITA